MSTEIKTCIFPFYDPNVGAFGDYEGGDVGGAVEDEYEICGGVEGVGYEELEVYACEGGFGVDVTY